MLLRMCSRRQFIISVNAGQHKHEQLMLLRIGQGQIAKTKDPREKREQNNVTLSSKCLQNVALVTFIFSFWGSSGGSSHSTAAGRADRVKKSQDVKRETILVFPLLSSWEGKANWAVPSRYHTNPLNSVAIEKILNYFLHFFSHIYQVSREITYLRTWLKQSGHTTALCPASHSQ